MLVDVVLYKTKLSTTDTMVFDGDTAEEVRANQSAFFATLEKKTFTEKLSFNGRRSLRIKGNYWLLNLDGYNYCTITYSNKTYFCFIDKFTYVNDNCTQVDVTTDYIQTYLTEIKFSQLFIDQRNYSINKLNFFQTTPYKNFYPVATQKELSILDLSSNYVLITVLCNKTGDLKSITNEISFPLTGNPEEVTTQDNIICLAWLYEVTESENSYPKLGWQEFNTNGVNMPLSEFLSAYSANIIDVTISDTVAKDVTLSSTGATVSGLILSAYEISEKIVYSVTGVKKETLATKLLLNLPSTIKQSLLASPYYNIYAYRKGKSVNLINPANLKFYLSTSGDTISTRYRIYYSFYPDYSTVVEFIDNLNERELFSLDSYCENVVYTVSAWEQYKLKNSATVGDALSTKHAYDMETAERNYQNQKNIADTKKSIGITDTVTGAFSGIGGGFAQYKGGNIGGGIAAMIGGLSKAVSGSVNTSLQYEQDLENATVAYENAKTTIAQESALLQLQYNDIKNSPDTVKNLTGSGYLDIAIDRKAKIATYVATNIEEIEKYHKRFGFETSLQTDITTINGMHDTNAQHFDYIRTMNASVISENIPKQSADIIAKIFDSGIYLWRNYEKLGEDYFSNYAGE